MRKLAALAGLALLAAGASLATAGQAGALGVAGPTPTGTGSYAYCNANRWGWGSQNMQVMLRCTYGIPATGVAPTRLELHYGDQGWHAFTATVGGSQSVAGSNCSDGPGSFAAGEYSAGDCVGGAPPVPDALRVVFSDGSTRPGTLDAVQVNPSFPSAPAYGFASGFSGIGPLAVATVPDNVATGLETARGTFSGWMAAGIASIVAVAIAAGGAFLVVGLLRRAGWAGNLDSTSGEGGDLWADEYGEALDAQSDGDDSGDEQGDDDFLGLNGADDLSDDDGEETDDGNIGGGIGLGDVVDCVSCGAELEFGWDFDYCPECGGV